MFGLFKKHSPKCVIAWNVHSSRPVKALILDGGLWADLAGNVLADQKELRPLSAMEKGSIHENDDGSITMHTN